MDPFTGEVFDYNYSFLVADTLGAMYFSPDWPFFAEFLAFLDANVTRTPPAQLCWRSGTNSG